MRIRISAILASFSAGFLTIIPGLKPAYFRGPSTTLTTTPKHCIKAYETPYAHLLTPVPYIATWTRSRSRTEKFPQKNFPNFSHSSAEFAEPTKTLQNSGLSQNSMLCTNLRNVASRRNFPKNFFQKKFGICNPAPILPLAEIFPNFFSKKIPNFYGPRLLASKMRKMLDCEKFFAKFFPNFFGIFNRLISTSPVRS
jgi:hypothetical protein